VTATPKRTPESRQTAAAHPEPHGNGQPVITSDCGDPADRYDVSRMDDFQVIAERRRVMTALGALTDQYRALNQEIQRRDTLKWMLAR
jgi:hypothetical protein